MGFLSLCTFHQFVRIISHMTVPCYHSSPHLFPSLAHFPSRESGVLLYNIVNIEIRITHPCLVEFHRIITASTLNPP